MHDKANPSTELDRKKIRLESRLLARQLTPGYRQLEYWKVFAGPLAVLIGVLFTIYVGVGQLRESRQLREEERFDRAVTRLAASTPTERLAGLAGLQLFLEPNERNRHRATVFFLADALATEHDGTVRGALLDSLSHLSRKQVGQDILNDALERVRDRNRNLLSQLRGTFSEKLSHDTNLLRQEGNDEVGLGPVSGEDLGPLRATASAIAALLRNGAETTDLSGIYCEGCDFSGKRLDMTRSDFAKVSDFSQRASTDLDLSGIDFHNAILKNANFIGVTLRGASFDSADLIRANFSGADLTGARLTDSQGAESVIQSALIVGHLYAMMFPDFTCADLTGADFTGSPFFAIYRDRANGWPAAYPILHQANLSNAKLGRVKVVIAAPSSWNEKTPPYEVLQSFPFEITAQVGSYTNLPVKNWVGLPNIISVFTTGPDFRIREPVRPEDWPGIRIVFSNLASARNLDKSDFPSALLEFMRRNQQSFSNSPHPTPCKPRG